MLVFEIDEVVSAVVVENAGDVRRYRPGGVSSLVPPRSSAGMVLNDPSSSLAGQSVLPRCDK
jgi:hypothetical protein